MQTNRHRITHVTNQYASKIFDFRKFFFKQTDWWKHECGGCNNEEWAKHYMVITLFKTHLLNELAYFVILPIWTPSLCWCDSRFNIVGQCCYPVHMKWKWSSTIGSLPSVCLFCPQTSVYDRGTTSFQLNVIFWTRIRTWIWERTCSLAVRALVLNSSWLRMSRDSGVKNLKCLKHCEKQYLCIFYCLWSEEQIFFNVSIVEARMRANTHNI